VLGIAVAIEKAITADMQADSIFCSVLFMVNPSFEYIK
jgi:hypothetical protein